MVPSVQLHSYRLGLAFLTGNNATEREKAKGKSRLGWFMATWRVGVQLGS